MAVAIDTEHVVDKLDVAFIYWKWWQLLIFYFSNFVHFLML